MTIRPYNKKDFRAVQDICMQTSSLSDNVTPINRAILCNMYCDYYLDNQAEHCFVAVDDNDQVVGYVLCCVDNDDYDYQMGDFYLSLIRKLSSSDYFRYSAQIKLQQRYVKHGYTAHLHIDILPEYCRQGLGKQLIQTLEQHLTDMFVEGIHLICGGKNEGAKAFYTAMGYEDIDYVTGAVVYGKKLFLE